MFKIFVAKPNFFIILLLAVGLGAIISYENRSVVLGTTEMWAMLITVLAFIINCLTIKYSKLLKDSMYNVFFLFVFIWVFDLNLLDFSVSIAFLICSIIHYMYNSENYQEQSNTYIVLAILVFIANYLFLPTLIFSFMVLIMALYSSNNRKAAIQFLVTYFFCFLVVYQILILTESTQLIQDFFCNIQLFRLRLYGGLVYFIPMSIFIFLSWADHFSKTLMQSRVKRNLYNIYLILFILQVFGLFMFSDTFNQQLCFLYFPVGIFVGRFMGYIRNPYIQNIAMLLSLFSLAILKLLEFSFL